MRSVRRPSGGLCGLLLTGGMAPEMVSDLVVDFSAHMESSRGVCDKARVVGQIPIRLLSGPKSVQNVPVIIIETL